MKAKILLLVLKFDDAVGARTLARLTHWANTIKQTILPKTFNFGRKRGRGWHIYHYLNFDKAERT